MVDEILRHGGNAFGTEHLWRPTKAESAFNYSIALDAMMLEYQLLMVQRSIFIAALLNHPHFEADILFVDNDAVWLSPPFLDIDEDATMMTSQDMDTRETTAWNTSQMPCAGFMYIRNWENAAALWRKIAYDHMKMIIVALDNNEPIDSFQQGVLGPLYTSRPFDSPVSEKKPYTLNQYGNALLSSTEDRQYSIDSLRFLPELAYPNGRQFFQDRWPQSTQHTRGPRIIHANYAASKYKPIMLRDFGLWAYEHPLQCNVTIALTPWRRIYSLSANA